MEVLRWGIEHFGDRLAICTSFQAEGMVIIDMAARINGGDTRVFTIDTRRLHDETHALIDAVKRRYGIEIEVVEPDDSEVEAMVSTHGPDLFYEAVSKRRLCCQIRKSRPLKRKLAALDAWVVGLRRAQSETRGAVPKVGTDTDHGGIAKLAPLADWTKQQVWDYLRRHNVPQHPLYSQGYTSIGCAPCTRAVAAGEGARAGRWWWEQDSDKECGIHVSATGELQREIDVLLDELLQRAS